mgnify:FL=1
MEKRDEIWKVQQVADIFRMNMQQKNYFMLQKQKELEAKKQHHI